MTTQDILRAIRREFVLFSKVIGKAILNEKDILLCKYHLVMMNMNIKFNMIFAFYRHCYRVTYRTKRIDERLNEMMGYYSEMRYILDMLYEEVNRSY